MPEGQISHRNARDLTRTIVGRPLVRIDAPAARLAPHRLPERLAGDTPAAAEARGKHHLLRFASGRILVSHLMMRGVWRVRSAAEAPWGRPDLVLATRDHQAVLYRCPRLRLLEPGEPLPPALAAVGPDLLDDELDPVRSAEGGLARADPARQVGDALMDQRLVAGIGNVYKSETCFLAGIDPWRAVGTLSAGRARAPRGDRRPAAGGGRAPGRPDRHLSAAGHAAGRSDTREVGLRPGGQALPTVRCGDPLARPGRREPDDLLVPDLPDVTVPARASRAGV